MSRFVILTVALFAVLAAPAAGAAGPIAGADALGNGVTGRGISTRYVATLVPGGTLITAIDRRGGEVLQSRFLRRPLVVPMVAYDGASTGLSSDGRVLVLAAPGNGEIRRHSDFVVMETARLKRLASFRMAGDFTLDAVSPDGKRLYFIETRGARYAVRAYDWVQRRLEPKPVIDPAEADEPMQGLPLARVLSRDGRWAYTLYDGNGETPFLHALDTEKATAKCVDLDQLTGRDDLWDMRLGVARGGKVVIRDGSGRPEVALDPTTFAAAVPRPVEPAEARGADWLGVAGGLAGLALLAFVAVRLGGRRHRRTAAG